MASLLGNPGWRTTLFVGESESLSSPGLLEKKDRYLAQSSFRSEVQKCVLWSGFYRRKWRLVKPLKSFVMLYQTSLPDTEVLLKTTISMSSDDKTLLRKKCPTRCSMGTSEIKPRPRQLKDQ